MPWTTYTLAMLLFSVVTLVITYAVLRWQAFLPLNPMHFGDAKNAPSYAHGHDAGSGVQHGGVVHDQHQLAGLFGREHDVVLLADGRRWPRTTSFRRPTGIAIAIALVRGLGRRSAAEHRQLLGGPDPRDALYSAAALPGLRAGALPAGRHSELPCVPTVTTMEGGDADHSRRAVCLAGGDQDARHKRRRAAERQLGAPV